MVGVVAQIIHSLKPHDFQQPLLAANQMEKSHEAAHEKVLKY